MGLTSFGVVAAGTITDTWDPTTNPREELGAIRLYKDSSGNESIVKVVQLDNNGCSQGEVLVTNFATLKGYSVTKATTTDHGVPLRGLACATIGSQKAGYMYIGGYCEKADLSHTAASGEYLCVSGSTGGKLTPHLASVFNAGTQGNASAFVVVARARTAIGTGIGSVSILGVWG